MSEMHRVIHRMFRVWGWDMGTWDGPGGGYPQDGDTMGKDAPAVHGALAVTCVLDGAWL